MSSTRTALVNTDDAAPRSVGDRFRAVAHATPEAVAVIGPNETVTYRDLLDRSEAFATVLAESGVGVGDRVGLCLDRSVDLIVCLLAVLDLGAAYVPLEPSYPQRRLSLILEDCRPSLVITEPRHADRFVGIDPPVRVVDGLQATDTLPRRSSIVIDPEACAYVMYTSGSTGTPKGVAVPHRAIDRLVVDVDYAQLGPDSALLHAAPIAFDASTFEVWGALCTGGRLVLHAEPVPTAAGLRAAIARHGVTTLWLTAGLFNAVVDEDPTAFGGLRQLLTGGEALSVPHVRRAMAALPEVEIINGYGPTETTTFALTNALTSPLKDDATSVPIGRAIRHTELLILDDDGRVVPDGDEGELFIAGRGVALGYIDRPDLDAERFVAHPSRPDERMYRTGDRVRLDEAGTVSFLGRADRQVKIRGFRIELGEIEVAATAIDGVRQAVVSTQEIGAERRLVAYVVADAGAEMPSTQTLRDILSDELPPYMVPAAFVALPSIPLTPNGKIDHGALPAPATERPDLATAFVAPHDDLEATLAAVWATALGWDAVGVDDNLFDLGATSLLVVRVVAALRGDHGHDLAVTTVFEHPTIAGQAGALRLERSTPVSRRRRSPLGTDRDDIAIVGMAGRFPGAGDVEAFWANLRAGVESITTFGPDDLDGGVAPSLAAQPGYVAARGILDDVEHFDAAFFGVTPHEAALTDPQQRILLEIAWESLEHAGHVPSTFDGAIGVFAGKYNDTYTQHNISTRPDLVAQLGEFQTMLANEKDYVATRIAHKLDLTGPALSIHTACSTSLVATVQAMRSLQLGECDLALAGGASITVPVRSGYLHQPGAMLSADGHTRSFDAAASGTVFSDGAAMLVLRRRRDAEADGDTIYGILRGGAVNNDGGDKASFTAPSVVGQAEVIAAAHADAGIDARDVSYVEAHGTATPLGDPIEVEALTRAFRETTDDVGFCTIGSVKSNIGHLVIAAGATGLIKTSLALRDRVLPATLHVDQPNPAIDFDSSPFVLSDTTIELDAGESPLLAGVSSFGVGGTNAHVVVEAPPPASPSGASRPTNLLLLSARNRAELERARHRLADHLEATPDIELADVAFTLQTGRHAFGVRSSLAAASVEEAITALRALDADRRDRVADRSGNSIAFLFPGQGAQHPGMAAGLYRDDVQFRADVDSVAELFIPHLGRDLRDLLFGDGASAEELTQTRYAQPAIFAVEYALAQSWMRLGIEPSTMVGHSIGEFACAAIAAVLTLPDAVTLVAARGRIMQAMPAGSMLSVRHPAAELESLLPAGLEIAADNSPALCVVSGPTERVEQFASDLERREIVSRRLHTSHAFHSAMMDPAVEEFRTVVESVALSAPQRRFVSSALGREITTGEATDPQYWADHLRNRVRFVESVAAVLDDGCTTLLEVGPRNSLTSLASGQLTDRRAQRCVASLGDESSDALQSWLRAAGELWSAGAELDPAGVHGPGPRRRVALPTYPFTRKRHWIDPAPAAAVPATITAAVPAAPSSSASPSPEFSPPAVPAPETDMSSHTDQILTRLSDLIEETSGLELEPGDEAVPFMELGFDSLFLTQLALAVGREFAIEITFRELIEHLPDAATLTDFIAERVPPVVQPALVDAAPSSIPEAAVPTAPSPGVAAAPGSVEAVLQQQLELMSQLINQQMAVLGVASTAAPAVPAAPMSSEPAAPAAPIPAAPTPAENGPTDDDSSADMVGYDVKKAFGAIARIAKANDELTPKQRAKLDAFVRRYNEKTQRSKTFTQENRHVVADPRVVTGFRPAVKELVYPIVVERSAGARLWDLDGNEYIDALNGFGLSLFGWQPDFVTSAVEEQLHRGHEIGPQTPLQAEVASLLCEVTGFDRAGFCNTGSEAVMGCARIARTVTGRNKIAIFTGAYHGIFDEVVVRGTKKLRSVPAAPGIMASAASNVLVLEYGTEESLRILEEQAHELAAVIVEPVQSRRPDFQPREFLHQLRELTQTHGIVYVFDEVVTGFRTGPGGAQEFFDVQADLAAYGKVIGGGLPIGVIAGKTAFMDALDGGHWEFGDDSAPPMGVTYFAGTFVRHPLALAAARAVLRHLKAEGPELQRQLNQRTTAFVDELNDHLESVGAPMHLTHFASLWRANYTEAPPFGDLLFYMMRDRGIHIYDGFPCFFTTAHGEPEFEAIATAFKESVAEMQEAGFLKGSSASPAVLDADQPPVPDARLGRDRDGNPAWYVPSPAGDGAYVPLADL